MVAYFGLALAAMGWGVVAGRPDLYHHPEPWLALPFPRGTLLSAALGLGVALVVVGSTRVLVRRARWAQQLHREFRELLGPLGGGAIAVLALSSGIAEEVFFRGAMQASLGWVASSLIFGAVHVGPGKRFLPWTLWATVMGFVFGLIHALTGELVGPIVAHVLINYENLHFIDSYDPSPPRGGGPRPKRPADPSLVSSRLRAGGRTR
ncbi:MAG: CPBP family intramembrane glutamic endopeptidase [Polyangiales bacterium]